MISTHAIEKSGNQKLLGRLLTNNSHRCMAGQARKVPPFDKLSDLL